MTKKIILFTLISLLITLCGCGKHIQALNDVASTVYIDSIGIDYNTETNNFKLYYHSTASFSLITSEMGSSSSQITYSLASKEAPSIPEAMKDIANNTNRNILLTHVRSVVLSKNFLTNENLEIFNNFIKTYKFITIDFNVYVTDSNLEDIYSFKNPENNNSYYSIITELDEIIPFKAIKYNDFVNAISEKYKTIKLQNISQTDNIWSDNNGKLVSLYSKGYIYFDNNKILEVNSKDYKFIIILFQNYETVLIFDNIAYTLIDPKVSITDKKVKIKASFYSTAINTYNSNYLIENLEKNIENEFYKLYNFSVNSGFDIFNIKDILYRKGKLKDDFNLETISFTFDFNLKLLS